MITKPDNLDEAYLARIHALLDAFVTAAQRNASLGMHERHDEPLAYAVADWAQRNSKHIETYVTTASSRTYEVWNIELGDAGKISVWPLKIGLLDGKDELRNRIEAIRKDADERIKALLEVAAEVTP